jgi:class 3 adenylate cyclase
MSGTINLASRLEGMNKVYGTTILISQAVHHGCGPDFVTWVLDKGPGQEARGGGHPL